MAFDIDTYTEIAGKLDVSDIDFDAFRTQPLDEDSLRCLRYMHDVEFHTICYLRDLLVTRAHDDVDLTTFLTFWSFEEYWHGEAIAKVLAVHDEIAGSARITENRAKLGFRERVRPLGSMLGSALFKDFPALHMTWGAVNEWSTQAGYAQLIAKADHPVLTTLLKRIMKQEGRHIDFYATEAKKRLEGRKMAQKVVRAALANIWHPVGAGVMPKKEVNFLISHLFGDEKGMSAAERIDRQIDRLPGLDGLKLVVGSVQRVNGPHAAY